MSLEIIGYNATFNEFVKFAEAQHTAGKDKAVARFEKPDADGLGGIVNRTIMPGSGDWVGIGVGRLASLKRANNITREAFMNAVGNMFGGVDHIPDNVKDAMKMQDYGKGKPLTARRILAVKAAIDAVKLATFQSRDTGRIALTMGFVKSEFPKLARTAHFYAQATGLSELEALKAVAEPNSKPNRLMQYGGRFLDNAENFANGLRLLDSFKDWFTAVRETKNADGNSFANAQSFTDLNFYSHHAIHDTSAAFERFVFEELAINGAHDLSGTDPEKLFGMKDNAAMRFFGTNRQAHFTGVMVSVPPEKRGAIFAVFDKLSKPLPETKEDAKAFYAMPLVERGVKGPSLVICRILRHLPEIESLMAKGKLTEANIVKTLCPDMPSSDWTIGGLNDFTHNVDDVAKTKMRDLGLDEDNVEDLGQNIRLVMEETCCTVDEAVEAVRTGKRVAPPKYMTNATYDIYKLDGTTKAARAQLDGDGAGDLFRAYDYGAADDPKNAEKFFIKDKDSLAFGFTFPDGTSLKANAGVHKGNIPQILDKLESLAGRVHPRQQTALLFAVSQAGICALKGGLETYGIASSEHAAVDFTLSRNDKTGDITIRYTSPKKLPFSFEWTATINVDGAVSTTPLYFMSEESRRFEETVVKDKALATGYNKAELPMLAKAFAFIRTVTGCSDEEALNKTLDPQSRERRLFDYGGRFAQNAENFADGLKLMDTFAAWHDNLTEGYNAIRQSGTSLDGYDYTIADTPSKLNVDSAAINGRDALEKFVFESIAANPSANLKETDGEKIFGFANNGASRFVGQGFTASCCNTVANIPPAKRECVFKVFDLFCPMCRTAEDKSIPVKNRQLIPSDRTRLLGRILRHLDDVIALDAEGQLTAENFIRVCLPDMVKAGAAGDWDFKALGAFFNSMDDELSENHSKIANVATLVFETTGGTVDEVVDFLEKGNPLPPAQDASQGQMPINELETVEGGFKMIKADLDRPGGYNYIGAQKPLLKGGPDSGFGFTFPGEDRFVTNHTQTGKDNISKVRDKVVEMCGSIHPKQASNVMLMLSQSGLGPLNRGLMQYKIFSSEHSAVEYTLSKDDETGDITIRYANPKELPIAFEWTATVKTDGSMSTTPIVVHE